MSSEANSVSRTLEYSTTKRRLPWMPYLAGVLTVPALYLFTYVLLRVCGAYYLFYNQGGWEMDGSVGYLVDTIFFPAVVVECDVHDRLRWLQPPSGG
jgi:hypothetical protein